MSADNEFPEKLQCLFRPQRYKVLHGGRGGAKSWGIARALLVQGANKQLRIPCCREFQTSIADSVHHLLKSQIEAMGLSHFYNVTDTHITGINGTLFTFHGLRTNVSNIKSLEGADIVWVEEADNVSHKSWETLIPTIRKEHSEIWVSFNPNLETDETYQRFVVNPPEDSFVVEVNWQDNPWFPEVLRKEMEAKKAKDYQGYLHIWEGQCKQALEGAVYAAEILQATAEKRICRVPYDAEHRVHCFWDLGWADNTSIWFAQFIGLDIRLIDHMSGSRRKISEYLIDMQALPYLYGEDWLPHDGTSGNVASEGRTVADILKSAGRDVHIVPRTKDIIADIDRVRTLFPRMLFDQAKTGDGMQSLRRYCWKTDDAGHTRGSTPMHDANSHDADALRTLAMAIDRISVGNIGFTPNRSRSWKTA